MILNQIKILALFTLLMCAACATQVVEIDPSPAATNTNCTFELGVNWAKNKKPYENFCSTITEEIFLSGYSIGRKLSWVENDIFELNQKIQCLTEDNCNTAKNGDKKILTEETDKLQKSIDTLNTKKIHLQTLIDKTMFEPHRLNFWIKSYESGAPLDELDIHLRWKNYVSQKGGLDKIPSSTQELIFTEIPEKSELPKEVFWGSTVGFGLGLSRQNRFSESGWKYAVIDSLILATFVHGITNKGANSLSLLVAAWGIPVSRGFQLLDVYDFNIKNKLNIETLKTQNPHSPPHISYSWTF